VSKLTSSG